LDYREGVDPRHSSVYALALNHTSLNNILLLMYTYYMNAQYASTRTISSVHSATYVYSNTMLPYSATGYARVSPPHNIKYYNIDLDRSRYFARTQFIRKFHLQHAGKARLAINKYNNILYGSSALYTGVSVQTTTRHDTATTS